jgi:hypothetical protein
MDAPLWAICGHQGFKARRVMTQIEIFRAGTHQPMQGAAVTITSDDLAAIAAAYDVALHEAPIVAGHPVHDAPAYGWVKGLTAKDGVLLAETGDVDADFAGLVKAGRFKKISASFYQPDSPANPKPGAWHLRHVGFLGAMPPAVKGLRNAAFAGGEEGVVNFMGDMDVAYDLAAPLARFLRRMREWFLTAPGGGLEVADSLAPSWEIDAIASAADRAIARKNSAFSDPATEHQKETGMGIEKENDLAAHQPSQEGYGLAREAALKQREDELAANAAAFAQKQAAFAEKENKARHDENAALIASMVKEGRVAPALAPSMIAFMDGLDDVSSVSFGEEASPQTPLEYFRAVLAKAGPVIDFGERTAGDVAPAEFADGEAMGRAARQHINEQAAKGVHVSPDAAVAHVKKGNVK